MREVSWPSEFESIRVNKLLQLHAKLEKALPWDRDAVQAEIHKLKHQTYEQFQAEAALERWTGENP